VSSKKLLKNKMKYPRQRHVGDFAES